MGKGNRGGGGGQANEKWRTKRGPGTGGRDGAREEREASSEVLRKMGRKKSTMNWAAELSAGRWALRVLLPASLQEGAGGRSRKGQSTFPGRGRLRKALKL